MDSARENLHSVSPFQVHTLTKLPTAPSIVNILEIRGHAVSISSGCRAFSVASCKYRHMGSPLESLARHGV